MSRPVSTRPITPHATLLEMSTLSHEAVRPDAARLDRAAFTDETIGRPSDYLGRVDMVALARAARREHDRAIFHAVAGLFRRLFVRRPAQPCQEADARQARCRVA